MSRSGSSSGSWLAVLAQMWYLDGVTGQLMSGNYTASINEQWLTSMVPAPSRRCLVPVHSADMAGTPAGDTETWGGPLANGSLVLALCNRDAPDGTTVTAPLSLLSESNAFFSNAMLEPRAAKANGYAKSVARQLASGPAHASSYEVSDVLAGGAPMGKVEAGGRFGAKVDAGDTKLFLLTPA